MSVGEESDALHAAVRAFARNEPGAAPFAELALRIARFQAEHVPGYARLVELGGRALDEPEAIPAVPVDAFRLGRVAVHAPELDAARFATSGTTGAERGLHPLRTLHTYEELALRLGRPALLGATPRATVVALAPEPELSSRPAAARATPASSLAFMMLLFFEHFDGRALDGGAYRADERERWLVRDDRIDLGGLERAARTAAERGEPLLLLATSFALAALLGALGDVRMPLPPGSVVMQTGGFKGRAHEIAPELLGARVAAALDVTPSRIVSEYGMTELTSQLYDRDTERGLYVAPPWLEVGAVDPVSLAPLTEGEIGLARFVDLGNVDSAVCIVTRDRIRRRGPGIELFGRDAGAPPRGCSLALETLLAAGAERSHGR